MSNKVMEVDFDKEIDALLRQDGRGRTITISEFSAPHLDAAELSAFAENALPLATRTLYMSHLADCDHCRSTFSALVMLNAEAEPVSAVSSVGVIAPVVEKSVPWYKSLFAIQNLAYGMGGLVILFAGFIGYTLFQGSGASETAMTVANKPEPAKEQRQATATNASANIAANSMPMAANSNASTLADRTMNGEEAIGSAGSSAPSATPELKAAESLDGAEIARSVPAMAPPPPPPSAAAAPVTTAKDDAPPADGLKSADREANKVALSEEKLAARQQQIPSAGNVIDSQDGPSRNVQRDNRMERGRTMAKRSAPDTSGTRSVGGKSFSKRDGVWYDAAYSGQATTNVRRNTDAYRNLDRGLRTIAESLDETLVVVWSSKAYRIQ